MKRYELIAALSLAVFAGSGNAGEICGEWTPMDPPAGATGAVTEITVASTYDAWAFAYYIGLVRWNGAAWNTVDPPDTGGQWPTVWYDTISTVGPLHLVMAGRGDTGPFSTDQVLAMWDGSGWIVESVTLVPDVGGGPRIGAAYAVGGASPDDVWIVGVAESFGTGGGDYLLTVHWDGSELTEVLTPGLSNRVNELRDIAPIATDDVWAVGWRRGTGTPDWQGRGMIYHWDGGTWSHVPSPADAIDESLLRTVTAIAADDVWAAGSVGASPLFMHWDGTEWSVVPHPTTTGTIQQIAAIATDDVWAVDYAAQVPVIGKYYHWDGIEWSIVIPEEIPGTVFVQRHAGLAVVGECDVWSVGSIDTGAGLGPFVERLGGGGTVSVPLLDAASLLDVSPNPIFSSASIRLTTVDDDVRLVRIYDLRGRLVRSLEPRAGDAATWDTRDRAGVRVPDGVYFVRVETNAGQHAATKVTVVR